MAAFSAAAFSAAAFAANAFSTAAFTACPRDAQGVYRRLGLAIGSRTRAAKHGRKGRAARNGTNIGIELQPQGWGPRYRSHTVPRSSEGWGYAEEVAAWRSAARPTGAAMAAFSRSLTISVRSYFSAMSNAVLPS
eukprot:scaffold131146_cov57-Phaeocystis_antarctica.AAC.1